VDWSIGQGTFPSDQNKKATIWKQLQSQEHLHQMAQQVEHVLGKVLHHHALTVVNAPDQQNSAHVACHTKGA